MSSHRATGARPGDDLTRWALGVPLPSTRQVGADRVGRVLVALVQYADAAGNAWPSADTLAADVSGVTRRDVRNALDALAAAGLIAATEPRSRGRVTRWQVVGLPPVENMAGIPATPIVEQLAGNMAGELAGDVAGTPAMKGSEGNYPPTPQDEPSPVHDHEERARASLERISRERRLPFTAEELLPAAYALGDGDPWTGYKAIDHATVLAFDDARSPRAVLASRLLDAGLDPGLAARLRRPATTGTARRPPAGRRGPERGLAAERGASAARRPLTVEATREAATR